MTQLAIQYPLRYKSIFQPLIDFEVRKADKLPYAIPGFDLGSSNLEFWLDISDGWDGSTKQFMSAIEGYASGVILPVYDNPYIHVLQQVRNRCSGLTNIGVWVGEKQHLKLLQEAVDLVAIPYWKPRGVYVTSEMAPQYHFYEFCNLDELRRLKPASLHTSVPITAAMVGIDLRLRERRPKKLPPFSYDLVLTDSQLELAVDNVKAIREALNYTGS